MPSHCLEIVSLSCTRGDRPLFEGLNVRVQAGELLHVAGTNGSGKTTLLRAICGLTRPAEGEIRWNGTPTRQLDDEYREALVYVGHKDGVQGELTAVENLRTLACTQDISDVIDSALERLGINTHRSFPTKILSQGQRRRSALARLLVTTKPLWILDEPYTALDTSSCRLITTMIEEHLARGGIALLSSHQAFDIGTGVVKRLDLDTLDAKKLTTGHKQRLASQHYSA